MDGWMDGKNLRTEGMEKRKREDARENELCMINKSSVVKGCLEKKGVDECRIRYTIRLSSLREHRF